MLIYIANLCRVPKYVQCIYNMFVCRAIQHLLLQLGNKAPLLLQLSLQGPTTTVPTARHLSAPHVREQSARTVWNLSDTAPGTRADLQVVVLFLQPLELLPQDGVTVPHLQAVRQANYPSPAASPRPALTSDDRVLSRCKYAEAVNVGSVEPHLKTRHCQNFFGARRALFLGDDVGL